MITLSMFTFSLQERLCSGHGKCIIRFTETR